jgi:alpha-galactosidase
MHPFFVLACNEELLAGSIAWSGNWVLRFAPDRRWCCVSGGLSDWQFSVDLSPCDEIGAPPAVLALGAGSLDSIAQQFHSVGRTHWYPRNPTSERLPVEWNHWWSYEDRDIDQETFRANVREAARLGLDLCTLDAGWFGASESNASWTEYRGDWSRVNRARFPAGIASLSQYTHAHCLLFGLWCEIEGLGGHSHLQQGHPEFAAMRDGTSLGYVCFGCPEVREWAFETLARLVTEYQCDWIKLDFNVDPGAGCNRTDHGHGTGDGLYQHYCGYYATLDRFRLHHPGVTLENCASGGLRIDLGMARRTHCTFLSDPDWPEHNLQVFWGASLMLAPEVCLHWGLSEWVTPHPHQTFYPRDPTLTRRRLDFWMRTCLLGAPGISLRLPDLPRWVADRIAHHARFYQAHMRRFVRDGTLFRLTAQPRRDGVGDRWCAFQYSLAHEHLLVVFRLPGAEPARTLLLQNLEPAPYYDLTPVDSGSAWRRRGGDLMDDGISLDYLDEEESTIIILTEERSGT